MNDNLFVRYAIALLDVAIEENKVDEFFQQSSEIIQVFQQNLDLLRILKDYGLTTDEKKETINIIFKNQINDYILNFMYIIIDNQRGKYIKDIFGSFHKQAQKYLNIAYGVVYSTTKINLDVIKQLENKVSNLMKEKVILTNEIDDSLIGGFKIVVGDYIIDESIISRINKLKSTIQLKKGDAK